jgi:hypothetical protein
MEYKDFLEALSKTTGWFLEIDGAIRSGSPNGCLGGGSICPLMAVFPDDQVYAQSYSRDVWHVADNWTNITNYAQIRQDLLKACHLES